MPTRSKFTILFFVITLYIVVSDCSAQRALYIPENPGFITQLNETGEYLIKPQWRSKKNKVVSPSDYFLWLDSFNEEANRKRNKSKGMGNVTRSWTIVRGNHNGELFITPTKNYWDVWMSNPLILGKDWGKLTLWHVNQHSFSPIDESIMLIPLRYEVRNFQTGIMRNFNGLSFSGFVGRKIGGGALPPGLPLSGDNHVQYYSSADRAAFPTACYIGSFSAGVPNGIGYLNFFDKDYRFNIVYRGRFRYGDFQHLQEAEAIIKPAVDSVLTSLVANRPVEIVEEKVVRCEFFPDYIDETKSDKLHIAKYIKWKDRQTNQFDSVVVYYNKHDFFCTPMVRNSEKPHIINGEEAHVIAERFKVKKEKHFTCETSISEDRVLKVAENLRFEMMKVKRINQKFLKEETYSTSRWERSYNVYGEKEEELVWDEHSYDVYGYDYYYTMKVQYRERFDDPWEDMLFFDLIMAGDGEDGLKLKEGDSWLVREKVSFDSDFLQNHKELRSITDALKKEIVEMWDRGINVWQPEWDTSKEWGTYYHKNHNRNWLIGQVFNALKREFPVSSMKVSYTSDLGLLMQSKFMNDKVNEMHKRIMASAKFAAPAGSVKGVWLDKELHQLFFVEDETAAACKSISLWLMQDETPYTSYLSSAGMPYVIENIKNGKVIRISPVTQ